MGCTLEDFEMFTIEEQLAEAREAGLINPTELLMALRYLDKWWPMGDRVDPAITGLMERRRMRAESESPQAIADATLE